MSRARTDNIGWKEYLSNQRMEKEEIRMKDTQIHSTITEAWNNNMPPIGFSVERLDSLLEITKFPAPGYYLTMSGKPNSDEKFIVRGYKAEIHDYETLDKMIHRAFYDSKHIPLRLRQKHEVTLSGKERIAREFTTSRASTKRRWCAVLVPAPDGSPYGLLVIFGVTVGIKGRKRGTVIDNPIHAAIAKSFTLSHGGVAR